MAIVLRPQQSTTSFRNLPPGRRQGVYRLGAAGTIRSTRRQRQLGKSGSHNYAGGPKAINPRREAAESGLSKRHGRNERKADIPPPWIGRKWPSVGFKGGFAVSDNCCNARPPAAEVRYRIANPLLNGRHTRAQPVRNGGDRWHCPISSDRAGPFAAESRRVSSCAPSTR
jgi:hypothetical protein